MHSWDSMLRWAGDAQRRRLSAAVVLLAAAPVLAACEPEIDLTTLPTATCVPVAIDHGDHPGASGPPATAQACITI